jgi:hypothetical protein
MSTKSREVLFGSRVRLREMKAEAARVKAVEALREAGGGVDVSKQVFTFSRNGRGAP